MHVTQASRVFSPALILHAHLHIRSVVSFSVEDIMGSEGTSKATTDVVLSENEEEDHASQTPTVFSTEAHEAAASLNVKSKKEQKNEAVKAKAKSRRILKMPQSMSVSALQVSLEDAKKKRGEVKHAAKIEATKVKLARKRVERVKAKAKELSNNDLYEVYLMRMQAENGKKAAEEAKTAKKKRND